MNAVIDRDPYRYKWWALFGVSILAFTAFLDATIVNFETKSSFLPAFHRAIDLNLVFAALILLAAAIVYTRLKKTSQ